MDTNENTNLVPVFKANLGQGEVNAVNARELHEYLGVGRDFTSWIKGRLETLGSTEGEDYLLTKVGEKLPSGTKYRSEYYVTLDTAKHLAMMEKSEISKAVRQYFIECEKRLSSTLSVKDSYLISIIKADSDAERAIALNEYERGYVRPLENKVQEQAAVIEEAKPKVEFYDTVTMSSETVDLADAAKLLNFKGVGRNNLYKLLRQWKVIDSDNRPYQKYVNSGYFKLVQYTVPGPYGRSQIKFKTVCYQKGLDLLLRVFLKRGYERL